MEYESFLATRFCFHATLCEGSLALNQLQLLKFPFSTFVFVCQLKTFCSAVLGMRRASDLLQELGKLALEDEPLQAKLLRSAATFADSESIQDCLETLEACIDQRSKSPTLIRQGRVRSMSPSHM